MKMSLLCYKVALLLLVIEDRSPTAKPITGRETDIAKTCFPKLVPAK